MSEPVFKLYHVGVNAENYEEAKAAAELLCSLFNLSYRESPKACFGGDAVEAMFDKQRGAHGHIGFSTPNMDEAVAWLRGRGIEIDESTYVRHPNGTYGAVYLKQEVLGFALHLFEA